MLPRLAYFLDCFAFRFSFVNYFLPYRWLFLKGLFYYNFFVILNDTIKVNT